MAAGKPVVSTCFPHAVELLGGGAGLLVGRQDPAGIAQRAAARARRARPVGADEQMFCGPRAATAVASGSPLLPGARLIACGGAGRSAGMSYPAAPFRHLQRLTDNVGLLEHAEGIVPRHEHGYCVDDVARGLVVVCREPSPSQEIITLGRRYLYFLAQAQAAGRKVPEPSQLRPPVARPARNRGLLGPRPLGPGHRGSAGPDARDPGGVTEPLRPRRARLVPLAARHGIRGARRRRDTRSVARPFRRAEPCSTRPARSSVSRFREPGMAVASSPADLCQRCHRRGRHRGRLETRPGPDPARTACACSSGC